MSHVKAFSPEVIREEFEKIERDYSMLSDTVPLSLQEMTEHPALFEQTEFIGV